MRVKSVSRNKEPNAMDPLEDPGTEEMIAIFQELLEEVGLSIEEQENREDMEEIDEFGASIADTGGPVTSSGAASAAVTQQLGQKVDTEELTTTDLVTDTLSVTCFAQVFGQLSSNSIIVFEDLSVSGDVTLERSLSVSEVLTVSGNVSLQKSLTVSQVLTVSGDVSLQRNLTVVGETELLGGLKVTGPIVVDAVLSAVQFLASAQTGLIINTDRNVAFTFPAIEFRLGDNVAATAFLRFENSRVLFRVTTLTGPFVDVRLNQSLETTDAAEFASMTLRGALIVVGNVVVASDFEAINETGLIVNVSRLASAVSPTIVFNLGSDPSATAFLSFQNNRAVIHITDLVGVVTLDAIIDQSLGKADTVAFNKLKVGNVDPNLFKPSDVMVVVGDVVFKAGFPAINGKIHFKKELNSPFVSFIVGEPEGGKAIDSFFHSKLTVGDLTTGGLLVVHGTLEARDIKAGGISDFDVIIASSIFCSELFAFPGGLEATKLTIAGPGSVNPITRTVLNFGVEFNFGPINFGTLIPLVPVIVTHIGIMIHTGIVSISGLLTAAGGIVNIGTFTVTGDVSITGRMRNTGGVSFRKLVGTDTFVVLMPTFFLEINTGLASPTRWLCQMDVLFKASTLFFPVRPPAFRVEMIATFSNAVFIQGESLTVDSPFFSNSNGTFRGNNQFLGPAGVFTVFIPATFSAGLTADSPFVSNAFGTFKGNNSFLGPLGVFQVFVPGTFTGGLTANSAFVSNSSGTFRGDNQFLGPTGTFRVSVPGTFLGGGAGGLTVQAPFRSEFSGDFFGNNKFFAEAGAELEVEAPADFSGGLTISQGTFSVSAGASTNFETLLAANGGLTTTSLNLAEGPVDLTPRLINDWTVSESGYLQFTLSLDGTLILMADGLNGNANTLSGGQTHILTAAAGIPVLTTDGRSPPRGQVTLNVSTMGGTSAVVNIVVTSAGELHIVTPSNFPNNKDAVDISFSHTYNTKI